MRFTIQIAALTGTLLGATTDCGKVSSCDRDPASTLCPHLTVTATTPAPTFYVDTGGTLPISVDHLSGKAPIGVEIVRKPDNVSVGLMVKNLSYKSPDGKSDLPDIENSAIGIEKAISAYKAANPKDLTLEKLTFAVNVTVPGEALTNWTECAAEIRVTELGTPRGGISKTVDLARRFNFQSMPVPSTPESGTMLSYPIFQKIGYVGAELYALRIGGNGGASQKLFRYKSAGNMFTEATSTGALTEAVLQSIVDFAGSRFFLLANYQNKGLQLYNCPGEPAELSSPTCDMPDSGLPPGGPGSLLPLTGTSALAIDPGATWAAVAVSGVVYNAAMPPAGSPPTGLTWQPVKEPMSAEGPVTQLALAPLVGTSLSLLVMRAGKLWLYSGTPSDWTLDPLTDSLQRAVANTPVAALAVGDLDGDGLAEVVVAGGGQIIPIANVGGQFLRGRPLVLPVAKESIVATAVTIENIGSAPRKNVVVAYSNSTTVDAKTFDRHLAVFLNKQ